MLGATDIFRGLWRFFADDLGVMGSLGFLGLLALLWLIGYCIYSKPSRTIAIHTWKAAVRFKFFWVMAVLLLVAVVALSGWALIERDTAKKSELAASESAEEARQQRDRAMAAERDAALERDAAKENELAANASAEEAKQQRDRAVAAEEEAGKQRDEAAQRAKELLHPALGLAT